MRNELKNKIKNNYTIIPNKLINDSSISDRARFLFCVLASKPDGWKFYNNALAKELGYSIETLRKYFKELIDAGWIIKYEQKKDENGRFTPNYYELNNEPISPNSTVSENFRHGKIPSRKNHDTYKEEKEIIGKNKNKKKNIDYFWELIPDKLKNERFIDAWKEWVEYRKKDKRKPITKRSAGMQLRALSESNNPIEVINKSIMNGWTGLFPDKSINKNIDSKFNKLFGDSE